MKPAWRGVVYDGEVWAWPMLLLEHREAFVTLPALADYSCRWRQWSPGGKVDFDDGASLDDQVLVRDWVARAEL